MYLPKIPLHLPKIPLYLQQKKCICPKYHCICPKYHCICPKFNSRSLALIALALFVLFSRGDEQFIKDLYKKIQAKEIEGPKNKHIFEHALARTPTHMLFLCNSYKVCIGYFIKIVNFSVLFRN